MSGLSTPTPWDAHASDGPTGVIPVLTTVVPQEAVSPAMREALDARAQDKADWMSLETHLLQALRPEIERMTTELVRAGLREAWRKRGEWKADPL